MTGKNSDKEAGAVLRVSRAPHRLFSALRAVADYAARVNTSLLLGLLFLLVVTPIGICMRLLGKGMPIAGNASWQLRQEDSNRERQF